MEKSEIIQENKNTATTQNQTNKGLFLLKTTIAGTSHIKDIANIVESIRVNDRLLLKREADNRYDTNAIIVQTPEEVKLGYVPKTVNTLYAKLMDYGEKLYAVITDMIIGEFIVIGIGIYMLK